MRRFQLSGTSAASRALVIASLALGSTALTLVQAIAKDVYLAAIRTCVDKTGANVGTCAPGGTLTAVPVWSFVSISAAEFNAKLLQPATLSSAVVPGPLLNVDSSDATGLVVHLLNLLPVPTSLIIPGQPAALNPTWINAGGTVTGTGHRPANDVTSRVRSLNTETAAGGTGTYSWSKVVPGSFIYETATHQGIQVQMGLHGGLLVADGTTTPGETSATAYGVSYTGQVTTYLSEIDSTMHRTIDASPTYDATPLGSATKVSPLEYWPDIFLTTQQMLQPDFSSVTPVAGHSQVTVNTPTLMRFFNGSLRSHVQVVQDEYLNLIAEDGNPYRYPKTQYSVLLDAGKTKDALMVPPSIETVAVYDRMLNTGSIGATRQGMVAYLDIASPSTPTAANDSYTTPLGAALTVAAPGVLGNDKSHDSQTLSAVVVTPPAHGALLLGTTGGFTYTPTTGSTATSDAFSYRATETVGGTTFSSKPATVTITLIPAKPVAKADSYSTAGNTPLTVAAPGVLGNDASTAPLTAAVASGPSHAASFSLNANGGFNYTAVTGFSGVDTFSYTATNTGGTSAATTVTVNVTAPAKPVADADSYPVTNNSNGVATLTIAAPGVLANDVPSTGVTAHLQTGPTHGTLTTTLSGAGAFTYRATGNYVGSDSFTYFNSITASGVTVNSAPATVTITALALPQAVADSATVTHGASTNINVLGNDIGAAGATAVSIIGGNGPSHGSATIMNGTITYRNTSSRAGTDSFQYRFTNATGVASTIATVTITVN